VLFIALLFFGWLWGVWGLLLRCALVAILKVICDPRRKRSNRPAETAWAVDYARWQTDDGMHTP